MSEQNSTVTPGAEETFTPTSLDKGKGKATEQQHEAMEEDDESDSEDSGPEEVSSPATIDLLFPDPNPDAPVALFPRKLDISFASSSR